MDDEIDEVEDEEEGRTVSDKAVVIGRDSEELTRIVDVEETMESVRLIVVGRSDEVLLAIVDVGRAIETDEVVTNGKLDEVLLVTLDEEETRVSDEVAIVDSCEVTVEVVDDCVIDGSDEDEFTGTDTPDVLVKDGSDEPVPNESDIIYDNPVPIETEDLDKGRPVPLGKIGVRDPVPRDGEGVLEKPLERTNEVELLEYDEGLVRVGEPVPDNPVTEEKRDVARMLPVPSVGYEMG